MKFLSQINVNTEYTLPMVDGTNGQVLSTDGSGVAYWGTISAGSLTLDGLSDVILTSPSSDQMLRYGLRQGDTVPVWHNFTPNFLTPSSSIDALGDVTISTATTGQILQWSGSAWVNATLTTAGYISKVQHEVKAGEAITKGKAVYVTGADGTNMVVGLASNTGENTSSKTMGLALSTAAVNGKFFVVTEGLIDGLNTSTATAGDAVWLGTNGNLIFGLVNKPVAPAHLVYLGVVTRVQQNNGEIFVNVQNGFELKELHDVLINGVSTGQLIRRDSDGLWKNWTPNFLTAEADTLDSITVRGATTTNAITVGGLTVDTNTLVVDATNNRVGIGTASPGAFLQVGQGSTTTDELVRLSVSYTGTTPRGGIVWHDTANVTGKIHTEYNGSTMTSMVFGSLYNSGYNSNALMFIRGDGRVGIGTTSPVAKLDVNGAANATSFSSTALLITNADTSGSLQPAQGDPANKIYSFRWQGNEGGYIDTDNKITFSGFKTPAGTSSQFLKANGTVDSSTYLTSTALNGYATQAWVNTNYYDRNLIDDFFSGAEEITGYNRSNWDAAYNDKINSASFSTTTGVLTLTQQDLGTVTVDLDGRYLESLPTATSTVLGGIKVGTNLTISNGVLSATDTDTVTSVGIDGDLSTGNIELRGGGATTITKSGGTITISSTDTDTNTTYSAGTGLTLTGTTFSVTSGTYAAASHTHAASDITSGTLSTDRLPKQELGISIVGNFGQWQLHSAYTNFNTAVNYWGWNYVQGNTNAPHQTSSQWYRGRFSLGNEYGFGNDSGDYWMEIAIPRYNLGDNAGNLFVRTAENGTIGGWQGVRAAYATNANYATSAGDSTNLGGLSSARYAKQDYYNEGYNWNTIGAAGTDAAIVLRVESSATNPPANDVYNWSLWQQGTKLRGSQIAVSAYGEPRMFFRGADGDTNAYAAWNEIIHSGNISSQTIGLSTQAYQVIGQSGQNYASDNRTISPSEISPGYLQFGFTSWTNNNASPWADYLHMRSYTDSSGGSDNLVMFKKSGIGMRIWQQTWGSATAYSSYVDVWTTDNFSSTDVSNWNTAYNDRISSATVTGTTTKTLTLTQGDGGTVTATWTDYDTDTDAQQLTWDKPSTTLSISNGNSVALEGLATESFVTGQGYITGDYLPLTGGTLTGTLTMGTTGTQYIRMGRFPGSTTNTGEAWIGRASDRNTGTMTVQLGGNSASSRSFEVVDYAWSVVLFSVDSSGNLTTYGTITENSSIRYKKDVVDIESTSSKVQLLRPVKYKKIENESEEIGLIAEDVAELFPEVVKYDNEGRPDGVNYSRLSVILLKAVQELTERVNKLENK